MIDDHSVVAQVPKGTARTSTDRDSEILACADAAYASDGLSPKPSKRVRDAEDFQTMGAAILGSQHFVSASIPSLLNTLGVTEWILRNGAATPALWEGNVGLWVNILLYAREGFSLVRRIFSEANDIALGTLFRPSLRALDELRVLATFAPFLGTDISAQVEPTITAVDASSRVAAVVSATVDEEVARELWRHRTRRATSRGALQSMPPEELEVPKNARLPRPSGISWTTMTRSTIAHPRGLRNSRTGLRGHAMSSSA